MTDAKSAVSGEPGVTFDIASFVVRCRGGGGGGQVTCVDAKEGFLSDGGSFPRRLDVGLGGLPPLATAVVELPWDDESNDRFVDQDTLRLDAMMAGLMSLLQRKNRNNTTLKTALFIHSPIHQNKGGKRATLLWKEPDHES
jgi:hypothetical protein